jgi:DegV family protein with EDD domain
LRHRSAVSGGSGHRGTCGNIWRRILSALNVDSSVTPVAETLTRHVAVVCESTACLPTELIRRYHIGVIPIPFVFGMETFLDGVDMTAAQFYARLANSRTPPKTSPPSPGDYVRAWAGAAPNGGPVVSVTVDSKISTLQRSARLAEQLAAEELPGTRIAVVDSLSAGMGQGFVTLAAARAAMAGQPLERVVEAAQGVSGLVRVVVTLDTLEYLARASRIPQVAAVLGGALAIKPIIQIVGGDIQPIGRVRTRRKSIDAIFEYMRRHVPESRSVHVAIQHAHAAEEAAQLEARVRNTFDCDELYTTEFTPIMGGYCGPGLLGLAFYCEARHREE